MDRSKSKSVDRVDWNRGWIERQLPSEPPNLFINSFIASIQRNRDIEKRMQAKWTAANAYETQAKFDGEGKPVPKFMATFPYPYMNGRLHLGHAYSMTKAVRALGRAERCSVQAVT